MQKLLDRFVINLKETFQERLESVFLYGSCAVKESDSKSSDVNLMVIIKDLKAEDLKSANRFSMDFKKIRHSLPIFMDKDEWFNSCDVYAIEYSDVKLRNKVLFGENLINGLKVDKKDLRLQTEREVKNLLVRLRQSYLANSNNKKAIKQLIDTSSKTFMVIFRTILNLSDEAVPAKRTDVIKNFAQIIQSNGIEFNFELFIKLNEKTLKDSELESVIQTLIETTNSVLKYVDKLNV